MAFGIKKFGGKELSGGIESGNGEQSAILNGENTVDGSFSLAGGNSNVIISDFSVAVGENNHTGLMAYYVKSIDTFNHKIYLSNVQNTCPEISENDYTDTSFETPEYEIGDKFDLIIKAYETYREQFHFISTILNIENNVVWYGADDKGYGAELPITEIYEDTEEFAQTFFVSSKPNIGIVNIGGYSNAEGDSNYASGKWSHVEGWNGLAAGRFSHVEGRDCRAAYAAHAEGYGSNADGNYSHAEGNRTQARGTYSHSEGKLTTANGAGGHAEGLNSHASGENSHAEGEANNAKQKASHAEGLSCIAEGVGSHAEGYGSIAKGRGAHSEGGKNNDWNIASTTAQGDYSHAEGLGTTSLGIYSHSEGRETLAQGEGSHTEGYGSIAKGNFSHAENGAKANAEYSHAEGKSTSNGTNSHSEGSSTANGTNSHAEGTATIASGDSAHTEGRKCEATASYTHAEGNTTIAKGSTSHAEGRETIAAGQYQHVQGCWNVEDKEATTGNPKGKYAHIVGSGTGSTKKRNIHTIDWDGNGRFQGDIYVHSIESSVEGNKMGDKVATETYVNEQISNISGMSVQVVSFIMTAENWENNVYYGIENLYSGDLYNVEIFFDGQNGTKSKKTVYDKMELTGSYENNLLYKYGSISPEEENILISGIPLILKVVSK